MLEPYWAEGRPHCAKVRDALTDPGISYVVHNPRLPGDEGGGALTEQTYRETTDLGGQDRVPYLERHYG